MENRTKCEICDKEFFWEKSLKYHMKNVHKKNLKCELCPKLFDRQSKLMKHTETHLKRHIAHESMFQCDQCGKEIQGKKRLRIHKRTHFLFRCQPCNKIFKDQVCNYTSHQACCLGCGLFCDYLCRVRNHNSSDLQKIECTFFRFF